MTRGERGLKIAGRRLLGSSLLMPVLLSVLVSACGHHSTSSKPELTVAAAADLEGVFPEIARAFERETGSKVILTFGSSGNLTQQIEHGAPFDVFASASVSFVQRLTKEGLTIPDFQRIYAQGRITLWQRKDSKIIVNALADLRRPEIKHVAIANPEHAPYGIAAVQALKSAGVYDEVKPKLVYGENIAEALEFAESGNADAAILARAISDRPDGRWTPIDTSLHQPIDQAACAIKSSHNGELAGQFLNFLSKPEAVASLEHYGFTVTPTPER